MTSAADLFQRHHLSVFRYLRRMTGSTEQAEDLTQDVFLRVVRTGSFDDPGGSEKAWLFRIARNVFLNRRRDEARRPPGGANPEEIPPVAPAQVEAVGLDQALGRLPESDREVFLMREMGGLGYEEISGICAITPDAVRSRIYRARMELRASLSERPRDRWRIPSKEARS